MFNSQRKRPPPRSRGRGASVARPLRSQPPVLPAAPPCRCPPAPPPRLDPLENPRLRSSRRRRRSNGGWRPALPDLLHARCWVRVPRAPAPAPLRPSAGPNAGWRRATERHRPSATSATVWLNWTRQPRETGPSQKPFIPLRARSSRQGATAGRRIFLPEEVTGCLPWAIRRGEVRGAPECLKAPSLQRNQTARQQLHRWAQKTPDRNLPWINCGIPPGLQLASII